MMIAQAAPSRSTRRSAVDVVGAAGTTDNNRPAQTPGALQGEAPEVERTKIDCGAAL